MNQFLEFAQNHWELWLALVAVIAILIFEEMKKNLGGINRISPQEAIGLINHENAKIIDLRTLEEFKTGHIIDAVNIDMTKINDTDLNKKLGSNKNKPLILVHNSENMAATFAKKLQKQDYKISILAKGIASWKNAGMPLTKD